MCKRLWFCMWWLAAVGCATPATDRAADEVPVSAEVTPPAAARGLGIHLAYDEPGERRERMSDELGQAIYVAEPPVLNERHVEKASVVTNQQGWPVVDVHLTTVGSGIMSRITRNNIGCRLAIVVDGTVVCTPVIATELSRKSQITGNFSQERADEIAASINRGRESARKAD